MKAEDWHQVDALFEAVLDRPEERGPLLAAATPEIRRQVEALLAADAAARTFLENESLAESLASWLVPTLVDPAPFGERAADEDPVPQRIGPYKVLGQLGEGGMGRVFLAARDDDAYQRQVAIKTLRGRPDNPLRRELLARFELERQALAQLEHPNIARLYDAGRDENGDPYLVLEHIVGRPIDVYCDEKRLDIPARLQLFLEVCQAVRFAHKNLLVHRDLKPSNILVTAEGRPMLLDFGIAKLLDKARLAGDLLETRTGSRPMTPGYASPEQIKGEPITTASDVYSLGVLLYELLTGRKPYRVTSSWPHELEKAICELEPERPSTAVFRDPTQAETRSHFDSPLPPSEVAARRQNTPKGLARILRGDLDTLLQAALRKNPDDRYASVEALAQDIEAFLHGLPLAARAPSTWYSLRKFARRHRFGVATAATAAVLLLSFLSLLTVQAGQIRAERDKAQQALGFLVEVFKASDPERTRGEELTAREILDRAAIRIEKELAGQPQVQATLMDAMGQVYQGLAFYRESAALLEKSYSLRRRELGENDPETLASKQALAWTQLDQGEPLKALRHFEEVVDAEEDRDPRGVALANAHLGLGETLDWLGRRQESIPHKELALRLLGEAAKVDPKKESELAAAELSLGQSLAGDLQLDRAREFYRRAEVRQRRIFGDGSLEVAMTLFRRGEVERFASSYREALRLFEEAGQIQNLLLDPEHPSVLANLENQGVCLAYLGEASRSIPIYEDAIAKKRRRLGQYHPEVAISVARLAEAHGVHGNLQQALALHAEALAIRRQAFGPLHQLVAISLSDHADVLLALGRTDEADKECREALALQQQLAENETGRGQLCVGKVAMARKDYSSAAEAFAIAYKIRAARFGPETDALINTEIAYGIALSKLERHAEAERLLRGAYEKLIARNKHSGRAQTALEHLVTSLRALGHPDLEKAERFLADSSLRDSFVSTREP